MGQAHWLFVRQGAQEHAYAIGKSLFLAAPADMRIVSANVDVTGRIRYKVPDYAWHKELVPYDRFLFFIEIGGVGRIRFMPHQVRSYDSSENGILVQLK